MSMIQIQDREFKQFQSLMYLAAGVRLQESKRAMLCGRLEKRLRLKNISNYSDYFQFLQHTPDEMQVAIDLLTTHETFFFREDKHFEVLKNFAQAAKTHPDMENFRVWSAACSSGEEAYSSAMVLADVLGLNLGWEIIGTDIAQDVIRKARTGLYRMDRIDKIPPAYLRRFCLKGTGDSRGYLLIDAALRNRVNFYQFNLFDSLSSFGSFDVIFLRNVMIYFDDTKKRSLLPAIVRQLRKGGILFIGHSESLAGEDLPLRSICPAAYQKI